MGSELQRHFPLISPLNAEQTRFLGYITVGAEDFQISIALTKPDCLLEAEIHLDTRLEPITVHDAAIRHRLAHCESLVSFLTDLREIVANRLRHSDVFRRSDEAQFSSMTAAAHLMKEVDESVGWQFVSSMSSDLSRVTLTATDFAGRPQELLVTLPPHYPVSPPTFSAQLPLDFEFEWKTSSRWLGRSFCPFFLAGRRLTG